ncbi:MAG: transcription antitermination factor NusB [Betaproteobacteria bacterium]|nr:transcription antitermination factor NusB [Betaproteobacteria bacterium]
MSGNRHRAREFAVQGIYQWLLNHQSITQLAQQMREREEYADLDEEWCLALMQGVIGSVDELDVRIAAFVDRPMQVLSPVEHAVLLLGAEELLNHPEVPYRVVINEAVELTKTFGGVDGHKYVNGVMDKLAVAIRGEEVVPRKMR